MTKHKLKESFGDNSVVVPDWTRQSQIYVCNGLAIIPKKAGGYIRNDLNAFESISKNKKRVTGQS